MTGMLMWSANRYRPGAATETHTYTASTAAFPNPERGWFSYTETHYQADNSGYVPLDAGALATARTTLNRTLVFRYVVMEKFLSQDTLDAGWLTLLAADLAAVRAAGCKAILRFAYSTSGDMTPPYGADPPAARVLGHIAQLAATVNAAADVVHAVQTGFIGMWGEWYYTDNFGDLGTVTTGQKADRVAVIAALLSNLDPRIFVQVRYVGVKRWAADAGLDLARIGFHNDAIGAPFGDYGTFTTFTDLNEAGTRAYLAAQTALGLPMGGESAVADPPNTEYPAMRAQLAAYRWSYLNPLYHPDVLSSWSAPDLAEVDRLLGYRLRLTTATLPVAAAAAGPVSVSLNVANDGWGRVLTGRPVQLVFVNGGTVVARTLAVDPRTFAPGSTVAVTETVTAPAAGSWAVHLRIPDPDAGLAALPAYAVQLANTGVWDPATGRNALGHTLSVS